MLAYELPLGLMLMTTLVVSLVAQFRQKPFAIRIPFIIGTIALGGMFRGVDEGNESLFWFGLVITVLLLPLLPDAIRKESSDKT